MHSYKTLALLALVASTASPAFSAPILDSQQQARANVDERASAIPTGSISSILKNLGTNAAFGALPVVLEHFLAGNSTRRELLNTPPDVAIERFPVELDERASALGGAFSDLLSSLKTSDPLGKVVSDNLLGGLASGVGAIGVGELLNHTRREPSPLAVSDLSGLGKTLVGTLASLAAANGVESLFNRDDTSSQDLIDALRLFGRHFDERASAAGSIFGDLLNSFKTSGTIGKVLGDGLLGGIASGAGALGVGELLNNTRREPEAPSSSGSSADAAGRPLTPEDLISILSRALEELD